MTRITATLLLVGICCAGCSYGEETFAKIELGRPPGAGVLQKDKLRGDRMFALDVPALLATSSVRVLCDEKGNVIAKHYLDNAHAHWVVVRTFSFRWVAELVVPPTFLREAEKVGYVGSMNPRVPANAVEYVVATLQKMSVDPQNIAREDSVAIPTGFIAGGIFYWWGPGWGQYGHTTDDWILRDWKQLAGLTRAGFDRTLRNPYGGTIRIQNLGAGRVRLEGRYFTFWDPFSMATATMDSDREILRDADLDPPYGVAAPAEPPPEPG